MAPYCRRLLFVLKEFDLAEAFFRLFFRFVRAAEIFALFRKHFETAGDFFDHAALRERRNASQDAEQLWLGAERGAIPYISENAGENGFAMGVRRN